MKVRKRYVSCAILIVILLLVGILYAAGVFHNSDEEIYQISYIYRSSLLDESQQSIKQGISKAASDYNFEVKEVTFESYITVEEQLALITKEVESGADAILIEPLDDESIYQALAEIDKKIPVILVNGLLDEDVDNTFTCVNTDYYSMGSDLGFVIGEEETIDSVYLLQEVSSFRDKNEICQGVYAVLEETGIEVYVMEIDADYTVEDAIRDIALGKYLADAFIVFTGDDLEFVGESKEELNALSAKYLFGFEKSNVIITYLENDIINGIGVPNEYSIGYQSASAAIQELNGNPQEDIEVEYEIINRETIYTIENQRLLFPFMQ